MTNKKNTDLSEATAAEGLALTDAELVEARKEGAKEDAKEAAKDTHRFLTDGSNPGAADDNRWHGSDEIMPFAPVLDLGLSDFEQRVAAKNTDDGALPEEKLYGLLKLERNGQNRTPYVKALMKRLKLKAEDLPPGSKSYTNDMTNITDL